MANDLNKMVLKAMEILAYGYLTTKLISSPEYQRLLQRYAGRDNGDPGADNVVDLARWRERTGK
jgi:hypothetical protein